MEINIIQKIAIYALPVMFAITLHEAAHGFVARYFGDPTAYMLGRVTLNPLKHIDPIGTVILPLSMFALGIPPFGWAKPVPVNFNQLRNPKRDMLWVAAAGPFANLLMVILWGLVIRVAGLISGNPFYEPMVLMGVAGIFINIMLMVLNLFPLPPLDGGRIAVSLLPQRAAYTFSRIEPYGFIILLILLYTNVLGTVISPFINLGLSLLAPFSGMSSTDLIKLIHLI
ncbi:MAG: site-2 protease family protein [Pseudomonadota bacterium]